MFMKRVFLLFLITIMFVPVIVRGQNDDAMNRQVRLQQAAQNDGMYEYVMTGHYTELYGPAKKVNMSQVEERIREQQRKEEQQQMLQQQQPQQTQHNTQDGQRAKTIQSGGITFVTDEPPSQRSKNKSRTNANRQKKMQEEARRRAFQEQRRQETARRAEEHMRQEEERKRREYERVKAEEARKSQAEYIRHASQVDYQVNEGRDFMYNYQVQGTEIQESSYVPSTTLDEPVSIVPKGGYGQKNLITLNGDEHVTTQMEEWQNSADLARSQAISRPISACEDVIEVVPIGNGCGPANGIFEQKMARVGLFLDAARNVMLDPMKMSVKEEMGRLDNVCSDIHDPGYVYAKNKWEKSFVDLLLIGEGGQIMGFATLAFGEKAWKEAQQAANQSKALEKEYKGKFDPQKQLLRKVRKCGTDKSK